MILVCIINTHFAMNVFRIYLYFKLGNFPVIAVCTVVISLNNQLLYFTAFKKHQRSFCSLINCFTASRHSRFISLFILSICAAVMVDAVFFCAWSGGTITAFIFNSFISTGMMLYYNYDSHAGIHLQSL